MSKPIFIKAKKPNGQSLFINIIEIKAFKDNPMNEKQCIIYLNAEDINLNAFSLQTDDEESSFTTNVFYVDKEVLYDLIEYYPVENADNNESDDEEIGVPLTEDDDQEDPNEDALATDDEEIGVPLTDDDEFEDPNEE